VVLTEVQIPFAPPIALQRDCSGRDDEGVELSGIPPFSFALLRIRMGHPVVSASGRAQLVERRFTPILKGKILQALHSTFGYDQDDRAMLL
jgi:hypothetical protein